MKSHDPFDWITKDEKKMLIEKYSQTALENKPSSVLIMKAIHTLGMTEMMLEVFALQLKDTPLPKEFEDELVKEDIAFIPNTSKWMEYAYRQMVKEVLERSEKIFGKEFWSE